MAQGAAEVERGQLDLLVHWPVLRAQGKDYVRRAQEVLIGQALVERLIALVGVMGRQHQAQVIDACRRRRSRWLGLRHMATEDERNGLASWMTFPIDLQEGEVLRIEAQLHAPTNQRWIHAIPIASQRDRGGAGDAAQHRPAESFAQQRRFDGVERTMAAGRAAGARGAGRQAAGGYGLI